MRRSDDTCPQTARPRHGFVYVANAHDGPMAHAEPGLTVRIPGRGSPWIAVVFLFAAAVTVAYYFARKAWRRVTNRNGST